MPNPSSIAVEGLATDYPAGELIAAHTHHTHQIVHAVTGVMRVLADDGTWIVPPGRGLWVPAGIRHEIRCIGRVKMRTVYLEGDHPSCPSVVQVTRISALMREIMVRLADGVEAHLLPHLTALVIDEIPTLDVEPLRLPAPADERMALLISALEKDPADSTPLHGWADRLGMSPRTLIRHIRDETGMSFRELRRQARIMAALERLANGDSVTKVALDVGFDSPSAFIQSFRRVTGKTPRRYMK